MRMTPRLKAHFEAAMNEAGAATAAGELDAAWRALERAHILGQRWIGPHLRTHVGMLRVGWQRRDSRELAGQLMRLALVVPGTVLGRLPAGNTGGANVSAFRPMPVPRDLQRLMDEAQGGTAR